MNAPIEPPQLVLCVPGPWADRREFVMSIAALDAGYLAAGPMLMNIATKFKCEVVFEGADARMQRAFQAAGPHWRDSEAMQAIAGHQSVVYLVGRGGSHEAANAMIEAAAVLLKAGGLGVKVESSGIAHPPERWLDFTQHLYLFKAHEALVIYVHDESSVHSCGMHVLGHPDAYTDRDCTGVEADLLRDFTHFLFTESPTIKHGQTFAIAPSAPVYRIEQTEPVDYGSDSLFNNPYGMWRLVRA